MSHLRPTYLRKKETYKVVDSIQYIPLIGHLNLLGGWSSEDQKTNTRKDTCMEKIGLRLHILSTILHSILDTIGRTYVSCEGIHKHTLMISETKSREG